MKTLTNILVLSISILFISCTTNLKREIVSTYPDNQPMKEIYYKWVEDTKVVVKEIRYYNNGLKQQEGEFENDKKSGNWKYWNEDGTIWSEGEFLNDKREGKGIVWYKDGTKYYESEWKDGKPNGKWKFYKAGKVEQVVEYKMGEIIKKETF